MAYTNDFREILVNILDGSNVDPTELEYVELGSGTTPATSADTSLETPFYRKAITVKTPLVTELQSLLTLLESEGNTSDIYELGFFLGGTGTIGTGVMMSRIVFTIPLTKNSGNVLNIIRTDKITI